MQGQGQGQGQGQILQTDGCDTNENEVAAERLFFSMTRSERLLAIVQTLRGRHTPATAADLAGEFDVSERTIYRDIAVLVSRGALIEGAAGFGYVLRPGTFLPPMTFAPDEADAIILGLRFVMRRGDPALVDGARSAMAKIAEVMPDDAAHQARANGLV